MYFDWLDELSLNFRHRNGLNHKNNRHPKKDYSKLDNNLLERLKRVKICLFISGSTRLKYAHVTDFLRFDWKIYAYEPIPRDVRKLETGFCCSLIVKEQKHTKNCMVRIITCTRTAFSNLITMKIHRTNRHLNE